ncbi:MAG: DsrE family protein [Planctomycetales bacterium]|nr:DsrE family protein [Planctomycetales bacterium]
MAAPSSKVVVILTVGKADNGKNATMAFSCALTALAMGQEAAVFLTSDGSVWGYRGSARGIVVQGFPPLDELISQFMDAGGRLLLCSVCHRTCSTGGPEDPPAVQALPKTEIAGFATVLDLAANGTAISF